MVLGKLPVPRRPTIWMTVGQGPTALAVGAGGGCLDIFTLIYPFFLLSPSLWETARYRLKYCLKGPLNPKPTNQPTEMYTCFLAQFARVEHEKKFITSEPAVVRMKESRKNGTYMYNDYDSGSKNL